MPGIMYALAGQWQAKAYIVSHKVPQFDNYRAYVMVSIVNHVLDGKQYQISAVMLPHKVVRCLRDLYYHIEFHSHCLFMCNSLRISKCSAPLLNRLCVFT